MINETLEQQIQRQAREMAQKRMSASHGSNVEAQRERVAGRAEHFADVTARIVKRDSCVKCGTRYDLHANHGCKRWRGSE